MPVLSAPEVEPVFGQIKFNKDIIRFLLKGLEKALKK